MIKLNSLLKTKIGIWAPILAAIVTITAPFVTFIQNKLEERRERKINDEIVVLKKHILEKISVIEHDFHPEQLANISDTIDFISAMKNFYNDAFDLCALWEIANEEIDYDKYIKTKELDKFSSSIQNDIVNRMKYGEKTSSVVNDMLIIAKIINCDSLNKANYPIPNISNYYEMMNKISKRNEKYADISTNIENLALNIQQKMLRQQSIRHDLKKLSKSVKQLKDVETLEFDLQLMDLIIKTNTANGILLRSIYYQ